MEGFMRHAVEMGSDAMIYIPSFIQTGPGIQVIGRDSQTAWRSHRPTFIFKSKKSRIKRKVKLDGRVQKEGKEEGKQIKDQKKGMQERTQRKRDLVTLLPPCNISDFDIVYCTISTHTKLNPSRYTKLTG
jgi:uncharacterized C2H2 Zn-finger protein